MSVFKDQFTGLMTPFVGLRGRLSASIMAPAVLMGIILIVRLQFLRFTLENGIDLAHGITAQSCFAVEKTAEVMVQLPLQTIDVANKMVEAGVKRSIKAFLDSISDMITIVENLSVFALEMTVGTYACLTISLLDVAAYEALNATQSVIKIANVTAQSIANDLDDGLNHLSKFINGAIGLIQEVTDFVTGGNNDLKRINLTISELRHVSISPTVNNKLTFLSNDVPTYEKTRETVLNLIREPFDDITTRVRNVNLTQLVTFKPVRANLTTPITNPVSCDTVLLDRVSAEAKTTIATCISIICGVCGLIIVGIVLFEIYSIRSKWSRLERLAIPTSPLVLGDNASTSLNTNTVAAVETFVAPYAVRKLIELVSKHIKRDRDRNMWLWHIQYICQPNIIRLLTLSLSFAAISLLELIVYRVAVSASHDIYRESKIITRDMKKSIDSLYSEWISSTNSEILNIQGRINQNAVGWAHSGVYSLNNSLATFLTEINDEVSSAFGGTPLQQPISSVVRCLLGNKINAIEKGLTWIYNHSSIQLPTLPADLFPFNQTNFTSIAGTQRDPLNPTREQKAHVSAEDALEYVLRMINTEIQITGIISVVCLAIWLVITLNALLFARLSKCEPEKPETANDKAITSFCKHSGEPDDVLASMDRDSCLFKSPSKTPHVLSTDHHRSYHISWKN